ncbi:hypothetical protein [Moraxella lacunata]
MLFVRITHGHPTPHRPKNHFTFQTCQSVLFRALPSHAKRRTSAVSDRK